jgi:DNA-binding transcriptional LysR family regulator
MRRFGPRRKGALVRVLSRYEVKPSELYIVYPTARFMRPAVRAFVDFSAPALRAIEGIA